MLQVGKELVRKLKKEIQFKETLKEYCDYMNHNYKGFAYIRFALLYGTFYEVMMETEDVWNKLNPSYNEILQKQIQRFLNEQLQEDDLDTIEKLRNEITEDMKILTVYVDKFQVYEHMLNRIQYQFEDVEEVDVDVLIEEMFAFIFADKDNVIINDKIRSLMYELPIRMTKAKFYEYIFDAMDIYNGTSQDGIDNFLYMIKTVAGIDCPANIKETYPDMYAVLEQFENVDYSTISKDEFEKLDLLRKDSVLELQERVNLLLQLQEVVNHVYALIMTKDSNVPEDKAFVAANEIVKRVNCAFIEQADSVDELELYYMDLEGKQESIYEDIQVAEGMIYELMTNFRDKIQENDQMQDVKRVQMVMNLLSDSVFMELDMKTDYLIVDTEYIMAEKNKLAEEFAKVFENHARVYNQSIMAMVLSKLPVIFNSQKEMKEYFEHTLSRCNNKNLLYASSKLIRDIIIASE